MKPNLFTSIHYLAMSLLVTLFVAGHPTACDSIGVADSLGANSASVMADEDAPMADPCLPQSLIIWDGGKASGGDAGLRTRRTGTGRWSVRETNERLSTIDVTTLRVELVTSRIMRANAFSTTLSSIRIQV